MQYRQINRAYRMAYFCPSHHRVHPYRRAHRQPVGLWRIYCRRLQVAGAASAGRTVVPFAGTSVFFPGCR